MNDTHDMGGRLGAGPIAPEKDEPTFHEPWERDVFALFFVTAGQGLYNLDEFRHAIERMDSAHYMGSSYYEHWLISFETLLTEKGVIGKEELAARIQQVKENPEKFAITSSSDSPSELGKALKGAVHSGASTMVETGKTPTFKLGDKVVTRNVQPTGHTRLPKYVRGKHGVVEMIHGSFILPDSNAHGRGQNPEPVYAIKFDAREVWGEQAPANDSVYVDLWESYLQPAS